MTTVHLQRGITKYIGPEANKENQMKIIKEALRNQYYGINIIAVKMTNSEGTVLVNTQIDVIGRIHPQTFLDDKKEPMESKTLAMIQIIFPSGFGEFIDYDGYRRKLLNFGFKMDNGRLRYHILLENNTPFGNTGFWNGAIEFNWNGPVLSWTDTLGNKFIVYTAPSIPEN